MARVSFRSADVQVPALNTARIGFWCSLAAFLTWSGMAIESVLRPLQDSRRETLRILPFFLTVAALICIHRVQRSRSRVELIGAAAVLIASVLVLFGIVGLQLHIHLLQKMGFPAGAIAWFAGAACFGAGTLAARSLPWYAGLAFILLAPASVLAALPLPPIAPLLPRLAYSGSVSAALAMLAVAVALQRYSRTAAVQDACYTRLLSATEGRRLSH